MIVSWFGRGGGGDGGGGDDGSGNESEYERAREKLLERLERREGIERESTLEALRSVPRHAFVPSDRRAAAYEDRPLPIGDGQTISAPHMVAIMLDLLSLEAGEKVLEIGTGCGYHAAVTAEVVGPENVYTVEYGAELAEEARETLSDLGYEEISVRHGDGREGWKAHAPYDAIYLTCAAPEIPDALREQVGGRDAGEEDGVILAPVGEGIQRLVRVRVRDGEVVERETHGGVRFVPLRGV